MTDAKSERISMLLRQTQQSIGEIDEFVRGMSFVDLAQNDMVQDATARVLSMMSRSIEQCVKFSPSFGDENPELVAAALSHAMTHLVTEYWLVDAEMIWSLTNTNVPTIKREVTRLLEVA